MSRIILFFTLILCLPLRVFAVAPPPVEQWVAVVAPAFVDALEPLIQHRRAEGQRVVVVRTTDVLPLADLQAGRADRLRDHVRQLCMAHPGPSRILLVGSILPSRDQPERTWLPPLVGTISRMRGQPTDAAHGCLDGGRLPTVAVGRFPARSVREVEAFVAKTLAFEKFDGPGAWRRHLTVLAGIPAFNPVVDRLIESAAFARFDRLAPAWSGRAVYTNPRSRFALPANRIRTQTLDYLSAGQAFILYLGHSDASGLYGGPGVPFLDRDDWSRLSVGAPSSVFITFGCHGCQLAGFDGEGYGLAAIRNPKGPVAVIGSHAICFASMANLAADGLFERAFQKGLPRRAGDCWLACLQGVARGPIDFLSYRTLDAVDGDPRIPQAIQRQEHLEMFVLLGDPALRLPEIDSRIELKLPRSVQPGQNVQVRGQLPEDLRGASVSISLERTAGSEPADKLPTDSLQGHRQANDFSLATTRVDALGQEFSATLPTPDRMPWPRVRLRVYACTKERDSLVVHSLVVEPRK